jgi:hypothetical protein
MDASSLGPSGGHAARGSGAGPEREEGGLRRRRLRDGHHHLHDRRQQERDELPVLLIALAKVYAGLNVLLVCDNGLFHHTQAVWQWLADNSNRIGVFWLPPCSPSLNLIERFSRHLKRTVLANVLFTSLDELVASFQTGLGPINGHRDRMGFMFGHVDVYRKTG